MAYTLTIIPDPPSETPSELSETPTPSDPPGERTATFTSRSDAYAAGAASGLKYTVTFDLDATEQATWRYRELSRFDSGEYTRVPWANDDRFYLHFVHLALGDDAKPGMVAYTRDEESGYLNRKVRVKAGKYLQEFYSDVSTDVRNAWIAACKGEQVTTTGEIPGVRIARTADEIESVYRYGLVSSCMGPDSCHRFAVHPTRAYGDSDLALAWIADTDGKCLARTIIWPSEKRYVRIYAVDSANTSRLRQLLEGSGYRIGSTDGAKIRAMVTMRTYYVMPYLDGVQRCKAVTGDDGTAWIVLGTGDLDGTSGYSRHNQAKGYVPIDPADDDQSDDDDTDDDTIYCDGCSEYVASNDWTYRRGTRAEYCDNCESNRSTCDHCSDRFWDSDDEASSDSNGSYCGSCVQDASYCEGCDLYTWDSVTYAVSRDEYVCTSCRDEHADSQFDCHHCAVTVAEWSLSRSEQQDRIDQGVACVYCPACAIIVVTCHACNETYTTVDDETDEPIHLDACPHCGVAPRCTGTGDLLAGLDAVPDVQVVQVVSVDSAA